MKVYVYYNLHRKTWSIKALEGPDKGRVIAHRDQLSLGTVSFKVSEAGRQRVLREQRKNVHAGACGDWFDTDDGYYSDWQRVSYNPYRAGTFVDADTGAPVHAANYAAFRDNNVFIY